MKAEYVGDLNDPENNVPELFEAYGLVFRKGKATEIPENLEGKFVGNSHFKETGKPKSEEAARTAEQNEAREKATQEAAEAERDAAMAAHQAEKAGDTAEDAE